MMQKLIISAIFGLVVSAVSWFLDGKGIELPDLSAQPTEEEESTEIDQDAIDLVVNPDPRPSPIDAVIVSEGRVRTYGAYKDPPSGQYGQCGCRGYCNPVRLYGCYTSGYSYRSGGWWMRGPVRRIVSWPFRRFRRC